MSNKAKNREDALEWLLVQIAESHHEAKENATVVVVEHCVWEQVMFVARQAHERNKRTILETK